MLKTVLPLRPSPRTALPWLAVALLVASPPDGVALSQAGPGTSGDPGIPAELAGKDVQPVTRETMRRAIALEKDKGYDITVTTNGGRMWANTLLQVAEWARAESPDGPPLFIHEAEYFYAYLEATGLPEEQAPEFVQISHDYGQHTLIEYRLDHVLDLDETETVPEQALAVLTWWPETDDTDDKYTYEDTLSNPRLLVENARETSYRLLDFGDQLLYDEMQGIRGRPTSGVLGALFKVLGTGRLVWTRMAVSPDGLLLVRAQAKKVVSKTTTVVVNMDGTGTELPEGRPDLDAIVASLERPLEVSYQPWPL